MGGAASKIGNVFSGGGDMVNGTTQTAGQWKKDGLTGDDIKTLGTSPDKGTQLARGALKGVFSGIGGAAQPQQTAQRGSGVPNPIQIGTNPQYPQAQPNNQYLAQNGQRFNPYANPNNPLYGG